MQRTNNNYKRVAITDLKKISEAFKILQDSNQALTRNMQKMASYYAEKYKTKLNQMQTLLVKKDRQLRLLHKQLEEKGRKTVFVVRQENTIKFFTSLDGLNNYVKHQASIKAMNVKILLCRSATDSNSSGQSKVQAFRVHREQEHRVQRNVGRRLFRTGY